MKLRRPRQFGFTIVELLIVIVVIGILAAITLVSFNGIQNRATEGVLISDLKQAATILANDNTLNNSYPSSVSNANNGKGLQKSEGNEFQYSYNAGTNTYCLTITNINPSIPAHFVSSANQTPQSGVCPGHTVPGQTPPVASTQIVVGSAFSCAILQNKIFCWGYNQDGQIGNGTTASSQTTPLATTMSGALAGKTVSSLDAGGTQVCAVADARAYCWGRDTNGQVGNGPGTTAQTSPIAVDTTGILGTKSVTAVETGATFSCALADGAPYCWGSDSNGQLGNGAATTTDQHSPVAVTVSGVLAGKTITSLSVGGNVACVIADGAPYCWGSDINGALGNGSTDTTDRDVPVAVDTSGVLAGKTVSKIAVGTSGHTCVIADGRAYCWGSGNLGALGNVSYSHQPSPVAVDISGVLSGKTLTAISGGQGHTCALAGSEAFCWGRNNSGELGSGGAVTTFNTPQQVSTSGVLSGKTLVAIGAGGNTHACAATNTEVFCWGADGNGQLGNGASSTSNQFTAVAVSAFPGL